MGATPAGVDQTAIVGPNVDRTERDRLLVALEAAGVRGVEDFGRFVSNTQHFRPSAFDERAAMPVLIEHLPHLSEPALVETVAAHLARPWAKGHAFPALLEAFRAWAPRDGHVGWQLGDALATAAGKANGAQLIELAVDPRYGLARQMVVLALWRFKADDPGPALLGLINDPEVALHAMSALRRLLGNEAALPHLRLVRDTHPDPGVRAQAKRQVAKAEKATRPR